jgi:glucose-6-phosphate isomerase
VIADFTHTKIDKKGLDLLLKVADDVNLVTKVKKMFSGEAINTTEKR